MRRRSQPRIVARSFATCEPSTKKCKRCEQELPAAMFSNGHAKCNKCRAALDAARRGVKGTGSTAGRHRCATSWCRRYASADSRLCGTCESGMLPDSEFALTGGRWVTFPGGVKRWVPNTRVQEVAA